MTPALRIVVPDDAPPALAGTPVEARLRALGDVALYDSIASDPAVLTERLQGAHVAVNIRSSSPFSADVIAACGELRHVAVLGVGVDNVDLAACRDRGLVVTNTPGHSTVAVAEHALGLALAVARALPQNDRAVREGSWARSPVVQLAGKTLGVVGAGPIGKRMAELGRSLGMEVLAWTFSPSADRAHEFGAPFVALEELLRCRRRRLPPPPHLRPQPRAPRPPRAGPDEAHGAAGEHRPRRHRRRRSPCGVPARRSAGRRRSGRLQRGAASPSATPWPRSTTSCCRPTTRP